MAYHPNWYIKELQYLNVSNKCYLRIITDVEVYLTIHRSSNQPIYELRYKTIRGQRVPCLPRFHLINETIFYQDEPGDTTVHTFANATFPPCIIYYAYCTATSTSIPCISTSPLLTLHNTCPTFSNWQCGPFLFEYYNTGDNAQYALFSSKWYAQSFTPSLSHTITSVKLKLSKYGNPIHPLYDSIRNTDLNGKPTGPDLCIGSLDTSLILTTPSWYEITHDLFCNLLSNTKYSIVSRSPGSIDGHNPFWRLDYTGEYPLGDMRVSLDSGITWSDPIFNQDFMFEEWGL